MSIGPQRPLKSSSGTTDPRLDNLLSEMPVNELFYKNSSDQMTGSGFVVPDMKLPSVLIGTDSSSNFKPFTFSLLAQQIIASNSEQMIRGMLGIEIPENVSQLTNDAGYITLSQIPSQTPQVNTDWNSTSGVSQLLNKPTLFSGAYSDLTGKPALFSGNYADLTGKPSLFDGTYASLTGKPTSFVPSAHTHIISDVTGLQITLDSKVSVGSNIPYSVLTGAPVIPAAQIQSDWNQSNTSALDFIKNKPTIPSVSYPVTSVNTKTGTVVLTNTDVGAAATSHTHVIADVTGLQTVLDSKATTASLSAYVTNSSLTTTLTGYATNSALTSGLSSKYNTPTGTTLQYLRGDGSVATFPTIPSIPTNVSAFTNDSGYITVSSLPNYRRVDNSLVAAPIKVKYYTATSDANSVWTVALGTDFTEVLDVQVQPVSVANTVVGVRSASLNAYTSTSTSISGVTYGNNVLTTVLIGLGANTLSLSPTTVVRVRVEGK